MDKFSIQDYTCKISEDSNEIIFVSDENTHKYSFDSISDFKIDSSFFTFFYHEFEKKTQVFYYFGIRSKDIENIENFLRRINKPFVKTNKVNNYTNVIKTNTYKPKNYHKKALNLNSLKSIICWAIIPFVLTMFLLVVFGSYKVAGVTFNLYQTETVLLALTGGVLVALFICILNDRKTSLFTAIIGSMYGAYCLIYDSVVISNGNYEIYDIHLALGILVLLCSLFVAIMDLSYN